MNEQTEQTEQTEQSEQVSAKTGWAQVAELAHTLPVPPIDLASLIARCRAARQAPSADKVELWEVLAEVAPERASTMVRQWATEHGVPSGDLSPVRDLVVSLCRVLAGHEASGLVDLGLQLARVAQTLGVTFASTRTGTAENSAVATVRTTVQTAADKRSRSNYNATRSAVQSLCAMPGASVSDLAAACAAVAPAAEQLRHDGGLAHLHFWAGVLGVPSPRYEGWSELEPSSRDAYGIGQQWRSDHGAVTL